MKSGAARASRAATPLERSATAGTAHVHTSNICPFRAEPMDIDVPELNQKSAKHHTGDRPMLLVFMVLLCL